MSLLIYGACQVALISASKELVKCGKQMDDVCLLQADENVKGISIVIENGVISWVGPDNEVQTAFPGVNFETKIDARGRSIVPGLVDSHTHPVWAGDRVNEFAMKLAGASYMDILKSGGGILSTVTSTREATEESLLRDFLHRTRRMAKAGTTLAECKSGYGLNWNSELKMLSVLQKAVPVAPLTISGTFCGAHAVPTGMTASDMTSDIINNQLPKLTVLKNRGELNVVESVDVFCEKGVFEVEDSRAILSAAKQAGFLLNFHAEELNYIGGAEMGASLGAAAISHLEEISPTAIKEMSNSGSVAVLLPTTAQVLRLRQPPARALINAGVPVALGSDFNPNAHCLSMPLVMFLACIELRMTPNEVLVASTLNGARSLRKSNQTGSIEVGKIADLVIVDNPRWEHLIYQLGGHDDVISHVISRGKIVYSK